jgi:membrane-associated phospholipid phosphatase
MLRVTDRFERFTLLATGSVLLSILLAALMIPKGVDVLWINGHHNNFTDRFFTIITYGGDGLIFLPLTIVLLFVRFSYSLITLSAWVGHGMICSILKRLVFPTLLRPAGTLDNGLLYFVPGVDVHVNYSFPSGHTATAFCFAILIALLLRKRFVWFGIVALALTVAYSRVYLLQHFLTDVVGGAFIGTFVAVVTWYLFEAYGKAEWLSRRLEIQVKRGSTPRVSTH